jgi:hypothetical protein
MNAGVRRSSRLDDIQTKPLLRCRISGRKTGFHPQPAKENVKEIDKDASSSARSSSPARE